MIDRYEWLGGVEPMLRFGPVAGLAAIVVLPLFEEANRTRAFAGAILRLLAGRGVIGYLPEIPGQGESVRALADTTLADMQAAFAAAAEVVRDRHHRVFGVAIRSGALLDAAARLDARWALAPQDGPTLLRELRRLKQAGMTKGAKLRDDWAAGDVVTIGGNQVPGALLGDLADAPRTPLPRRTVRLESDGQTADAKLAGRPLWRSAEPDQDMPLAEAAADDIAGWMRACAA